MARPTSPPLIIAHRGFSAAYRENSPAAWVAAVDTGADVVEVDIRMTRDGHLVCCHDANLMRLASRPEAIAEIDAADLAGIRMGGTALAPSLDELFEALPEEQPLLFDVKDERSEALDRLVAAAAAARHGGLTFGLPLVGSVIHVRAGWDAAILGLLASPGAADAFFAVGGDILRLWESDATAERLSDAAGRGRPVWVTTGEGDTGRKVGDFAPNELRRMMAAGVCGFLVNDPLAARDALAAVLQEQGG